MNTSGLLVGVHEKAQKGVCKKIKMAKKSIDGMGSWSYIESKKLYMYRYSFPNERKTFYGKTQKECLDKFRKYDRELKSKGKVITKKTTVEEYCRGYLLMHKQSIKPSTFNTYVRNINKLRKYTPYISDKQLSQINKADMQRMFEDFAWSKYNSVCILKSFLKNVFEAAVDQQLLGENPLAKIKLSYSAFSPSHKRTALTQEEVNRFREFIKTDREMYDDTNLTLLFLIHTGLRCGELRALSWKDVKEKYIDIVSNEVTVTEFNDDLDVIGYSKVIKEPKTEHGYRRVPLDDEARRILEHFSEYPHTQEDKVFRRRSLEKKDVYRDITSNVLYRQLHRVCERAQLPMLTTHELRHTFGSLLVEKGAEISVVSKIMGHSSVSTTYENYIHLSEEQCDRTIALLNKI